MLTGASAVATARESEPREADDNQQVLEFLQLVEQWRQLAAMLEIRPAQRKPKRSTSA